MPVLHKALSTNDGKSSFWARIVIVAYNSGTDLQACVDHLAAQTFQNFEVIIVNNASKDDAVQQLQLPNKRYSILTLKSNFGFSGGSNKGASGASADWIITLNPDSWAAINWLEELHKANLEHPKFSMLSSTILQNKAPTQLDSFGDFFSVFGIARNGGYGLAAADRPNTYCETFSPCGAAAAYKSSVFFGCGGFDEDFFCYLEDVDLGYRMRLYGERCLQCPDALVNHIGSSTVGKRSSFKYYYSYRNNVILILKNTPLLILIIMLPLFVSSQLWWLFKNRQNNLCKVMLKGLLHGLKTVRSTLKKRQAIQSMRKVSVIEIAKRYSWSIKDIQNSNIVYWKI